MIALGDPWWLALLPALIAAAWVWRWTGWLQPLRLGIATLLLLILSKPHWNSTHGGLEVLVLLDRSASSGQEVKQRWPEIETLLQKGRGRNDRLRVLEFADEVRQLEAGAQEEFSGSLQQSRFSRAAQVALALADGERSTRLLLIGDGYATDSLDGLAERLVREKVALDWRDLRPEWSGDLSVRSLIAPTRVQAGEPFMLEAVIEGEPVPTGQAEALLEFYRSGKKVGEKPVRLHGGRAVLHLADRLNRGGAEHYEVRLSAAGDPLPDNNRAETWVEVQGGPRVLLISSYPDDPVAAVLRAQGFEVELENVLGDLHPGRLAGARALILNNVPAYQIPATFIEAIDVWVRVQGGGLLMAGGKYAYGSGGWYGSAVDPLLPVSMELKEDHRKLSVALAIVMDRSGSMSMSVAGGQTKMQLANEGAARSVELLGDHDMISVFAVDSEAHLMVPLTTVGGSRGAINDSVRRIGSMGGGIYVYVGMAAAWKELQKSTQGQRHMILFSDAADSEEPGDYKNLIAEMQAAGCTVSVIGLGSETDSDAEFLKDIAARGKGRIFFNADPGSLPALFAQETVAVARSAFLEQETRLLTTPGWLEMAARDLPGLESVDGYNLSYLRPEATAAWLSQDEYAAPLLAFWQRGAGRAAAVSFPLGGDFSRRVRGWKHYGDLLQTLSRWLMGEEPPPGIGLRTRREGRSLNLELLYDDSWADRISKDTPVITLVQGTQTERVDKVFERLAPGWLRSSFEMEPGAWYRGAVRIGSTVLPFGPVTAGVDAEWERSAATHEALRRTIRLSGGEERVNLADIWNVPRGEQRVDLKPWALVLLLLLFLLEALLTRTGTRLTLPGMKLPRRPLKTSKPKPLQPPPAPTAAEPPPAPTPTPPPKPLDENRRRRYEKAKKGGNI